MTDTASASSAASGNVAEQFVTLHEFVAAARERLDDHGWGYLAGGTETETTVARNRHALDTVALRPRVLVDVTEIDMTTTMLGRAARLPVLLAPVGGLETFDADGALAAAQGAGAFGVPVMLSSVSKRSKTEIRAATSSGVAFQLYVRGGERYIEDEVEAAIAAGHDAFCFTVDSAVYSRRERDLVQRFDKPWRRHVDEAARFHQAALSWADIERIRKAYDIPLILKGIATAEDARMAVDHGVSCVYVSNHGGRQLDHGLGSLDVLPEIAAAVDGQAEVLVDGAVNRGTDVVKAIALGARGVGIGRLYCYALAAAGVPGLVRMLEILEDEVRSAMGLLGVTCLADLTPDHVRTGAAAMVRPGVLSAFPLLD